MRDVIWTIIVLWVVWKIYDMFKSSQKSQQKQYSNSSQSSKNTSKTEGEVKIEKMGDKQKPYFKPSDGEYVDYEEIK